MKNLNYKAPEIFFYSICVKDDVLNASANTSLSDMYNESGCDLDIITWLE